MRSLLNIGRFLPLSRNIVSLSFPFLSFSEIEFGFPSLSSSFPSRSFFLFRKLDVAVLWGAFSRLKKRLRGVCFLRCFFSRALPLFFVWSFRDHSPLCKKKRAAVLKWVGPAAFFFRFLNWPFSFVPIFFPLPFQGGGAIDSLFHPPTRFGRSIFPVFFPGTGSWAVARLRLDASLS